MVGARVMVIMSTNFDVTFEVEVGEKKARRATTV